jgi:DNA-binding transcriptional LysR family regulator
MDLDSSLLRAFLAVVEDRHFGRAAGKLFLTQQALSKRIGRLEDMLGVRLLERDRRGVALTAAGEQLVTPARHAVDAVDAAVAAVVRTKELTVDVLDEHLSMLPAVRALNGLMPDLLLTVVMRADAGGALETLRTGAADVVLGRPGALPGPWPADIRGAAVLAEPISALVPRGHPLDRDGRAVTMRELAQHQLWFPTVGAPAEWTELLIELATTFSLRMDNRGSTFGFDYWLSLVAEGSAPVSVIGAAMTLPPGIEVSTVRITEPTPIFWWWAMWRRRISPTLVDGFVRQLSEKLDMPDPEMPDGWLPHTDRQFTEPDLPGKSG